MKRVFYILLLLAGSVSAWAEAPQRISWEDWDSAQGTVHNAQFVPGPERMPTDVGVKKIIPRVPVIMVEFSDFGFTRTKEEVDSMFNAVNYQYSRDYDQGSAGVQTITAPGSIRQYFQDQSNGQYNPQFDIYGPVQVDDSCCANFANYNNVRTLVKKVCKIANDEVDFSQYDADNDGKIDLVYIYYAGFGRNDWNDIADSLVSNKNQLIWPHWSTASGAEYDGKTLRDYECANELDGYWTKSLNDIYPAGIGVPVHEFCHALGLPDLYPTNGTTSSFKHMGSWDVMDYGCYNDESHCPPSMSAYERWFLGWLNPTLLNQSQSDVQLGYIGTTNEAYLITTDGQEISGAHGTTQPYYLLENRQRTHWDAGKMYGREILGHGMMITRVTFNSSAWSGNTVNNDPNNQRVHLIVADGDYSVSKRSYWLGKPTDLFPAGKTEYTEIEGYPITGITEDENGVVHFDFMNATPAATIEEKDSALGEKRIVNGQMVIVREGVVYNAYGVPLITM